MIFFLLYKTVEYVNCKDKEDIHFARYFESFAILLVCENLFFLKYMSGYTIIRTMLLIYLCFYDGSELFQRLIIEPLCSIIYDKLIILKNE